MHSVSSVPIELTASAKYGHLILDADENAKVDGDPSSSQLNSLDFGVLQSIKGLKKHLHIRNDGCVSSLPLSCSVMRCESSIRFIKNNFFYIQVAVHYRTLVCNGEHAAFSLNKSSGTLQPGTREFIQFTFAPPTAGTFEAVVRIQTTSANSLLVNVRGTVSRANVSVSPDLLIFPSADVGHFSSRNLMIKNESQRAVPFHFWVSDHSVFKVNIPSGVIPAKENLNVAFSFKPIEAMHYARKVICILEGQEPINITLLAAGHNVRRRPQTISFAAFHDFEYRVAHHLGWKSPSELGNVTIFFDIFGIHLDFFFSLNIPRIIF